MFLYKYAGYAKDKKVFGRIVGYNIIDNEAVIQDKEGNLHKSNDVVVVEKIGVMGDVDLFSGDVIKDENFQFELELLEDGNVRCHEVDNMYNRTGKFVNTTKGKLLNSIMELVGNVYELRDKLPKVDFDVKIVKSFDGAYYTYFYACNNKEKKEVDLLKATFFGDKCISNEGYQRQTITYHDYLDRVFKGSLKEVGEREFHNYVLGMSYEEKNEEDDDDCEVDKCKVEDEWDVW